MDECSYCNTLVWIIVALFAIVLLIALYRLKVVIFDETNEPGSVSEGKWTVRKIVHCLLPLPIIGIVNFSLTISKHEFLI